MLNIFKIFSLFVSIIIGAGFASGKELFTFFATQKESAIYVIITSTLVFFIITYATLELSRRNKTKTYNNFLVTIFKNKSLIAFFEVCIVFFMFVSFSSMLAGFTSLTSESFGFSKTFARFSFVILNFVFLLKGHDSILKLSIVLVPTLVVGAFIFGSSYINTPTDIELFKNITFNPRAIFNGLTYASYNLITAIAIICTLSELYQNKLHNFIASLLVAATLFLLATFILFPLFANYELIENVDMPIYTILNTNNQNFVIPYLILMIFATLSTSVANAYAVSTYFSHRFETNYFITTLLVIFCGVVFSLIGFSNIVNFVYPIFGFFGIIKILKILQKFLH